MPQVATSHARTARLQIRVSVDEHMGDLYAWLLAMPATLRGRELVAQARLARALLAPSARALAAVDAGPRGAATEARDGLPQLLAADLGAQAVAQARARLDLNFLTAVPPLA